MGKALQNTNLTLLSRFPKRALRTSCQGIWDSGASPYCILLHFSKQVIWACSIFSHSVAGVSMWQYACVYMHKLSVECYFFLYNETTKRFSFCQSCSSFCERAAGENFAGCLFKAVFHQLSSVECL